MQPPLISGPIPPYSNLPIEPQNYQPRQFFISNVSLGNTTTVTTTEDHDYLIGQLVRLIIPPLSGCRQLNEQTGFVLSVPTSTQVVVSINSLRNVDSFISTSNPQQPQILAIGDVNTGIQNTNGRTQNQTFINGSFINIS